MLILPENYEIVLEKLEQLIPEVQARIENLSETFDKDDINKIVENMISDDPETAIILGALNENMQLNEFIVKRVSSRGLVTRVKDRKTRERQAFQTTGLSKAKRRQIARKATKTKRANPSVQNRAGRKRKKAMKKRKALGLS